MCLEARPSIGAFWRAQANRTEADAVMARLQGTGIAPERLLTLATDNGLTLARASELVAGAAGLIGPGTKTSGAIDAIRTASRQRDAEVGALQARQFLPAGVSRLPPSRPSGYDLAAVPGARLMGAVQVLETNASPVSDPTYANAADPLFATWFKALDALGTRTLTMAEMNAVIRSDLAWKQGTNEFRAAATFAPVLDPSTGLEAFHELHKFVAGFRGHPSLEGRPWVHFAGRGGETGAFARMTDPGPINSLHEKVGVADIAAVRGFFEDDIRGRQTYVLDRGHWDYMENKLIAAESRYVSDVVGANDGVGYIADPREQVKLQGTITKLLVSAPNSPERIESVKKLYENFRSRDALLEQVSVSGMTAELQMAQVLHRYLKLDRPAERVDVTDPTQRIDAVEVYRLYQRMTTDGELIQRGTVQSWLNDWKVPSVP